MSDLDLNSKQWCELVFDGKNTEFGAFQMRQESTSRHNKAMIIVAILVVLIITLPALFRYIAPKKQEEVKMTEVTQLTKLPPPEVKNNDVIKKVDAPPPPPLKSSIKFTAPKIVKDEEADREDVKTQEEIISAKVAVSVADVKGNDASGGNVRVLLRPVRYGHPGLEGDRDRHAAGRSAGDRIPDGRADAFVPRRYAGAEQVPER